MAKKYEGKLKAWAALGANLPTRLIETEPLTGDLQFAGHTFELKGAPTALPDRTYLYQAEDRAILGGVLVFADEHVWIADTPRDEQLDAWDALLADMQPSTPSWSCPATGSPRPPPTRPHWPTPASTSPRSAASWPKPPTAPPPPRRCSRRTRRPACRSPHSSVRRSSRAK